MKPMTDHDFVNDPRMDHTETDQHGHPHLAIQVLSVLGFGAFSIVAVSLAFAAFWVAGLVATILITWTWAGSRMFGGRNHKRQRHMRQSFSDLAPPVLEPRSSGNASFDAYRAQTLKRLENESQDFDDFLTRLRDARGASEFDGYMEERASVAKDARQTVLTEPGHAPA